MKNLKTATDRLHSVELLLLNPTPQAIREADGLLQQAAALVEARGAEPTLEHEHARTALSHFGVLCERVSKLLEGARRAHWIRMRLITSPTETYTARAETKIWSPQSGTVNVSM